VLTETLRYSCDIPAQSLAYKLGDTEIVNLRERMRRRSARIFVSRTSMPPCWNAAPLPLRISPGTSIGTSSSSVRRAALSL